VSRGILFLWCLLRFQTERIDINIAVLNALLGFDQSLGRLRKGSYRSRRNSAGYRYPAPELDGSDRSDVPKNEHRKPPAG